MENIKKKIIRIWFTDFCEVDELAHIKCDNAKLIYERLCKYYAVELSKDNPDYLFCDTYGNNFSMYPNVIRVVFSHEEYAPDFNVYDYAITLFTDMMFLDRVYQMSVSLSLERSRIALKKCENRHFTKEDLKTKTGFCSFVQSKGVGADSIRVDFFHELSKYKMVSSGGRLLNNVGGPVGDKYEFEAKHKFSISFINGRSYTLQDRPLDAFASNTLPIYWGNPAIATVYNPKAFVNVMDYPTIQDAIQEIIAIDNDDERYIAMMNEPVFNKPITLESEYKRFDEFLINIIENGTVQRSRAYWNRKFEKEVLVGRQKCERTVIVAKRIRPFSRVIFNSRLGQSVKRKILNFLRSREMKGLQ